MTSEEMMKELASLPAEAKREVEDFVAFLRTRYSSHQPSAKKFENEAFFGIWSDRDEMTDSTAWVRYLREKHWAN
ncbi:MAG: DUF2281 domain-containing protein [Pyrinomonadaceae bacterium]